MSRRTATASAVLSLALAFTLSLPSVASAIRKDYFADQASQESILTEMLNHPTAVRDGSDVYVAWQGPGFDVYLASYDESSSAWTGPVRVATGPLSLDGHGAPALFFDASGCLHIAFGAHWSPIEHWVANKPHSITGGFRRLAPITDTGTYPEIVRLTTGQLMAFWRQSSGSFIGWVSRTSTDDGASWGPITGVVSAPPTDSNWYLHAEAGSNGTVLVAFLRRDLGTGLEWYRRHDVYYMWRDSAGKWRNVHGDPVTSPVTHASADAQCRVYSSGSAVTNDVLVREQPQAGPVAQPTPMIQFVTGSLRGQNAYTWKFLRWNGSGWTPGDITKTDHGFDSGTFDPHLDGSVDSYVVAGTDPTLMQRTSPYEGRGGRIEHWRSEDGGAHWAFVERVSPDETGTIFNDPQIVANSSGTSKVVFTEWTNDTSKAFQRLYLFGANGFVGRDYHPGVSRLAGPDRVATSIQISKTGFPEKASNVVLATSLDYPDALAGAPLATALDAPVLLVPGYLSPPVAAEIRRLGASHAVILGSTRVLSTNLETELKKQTGVASTERIGGADRYGTALDVAARLGQILGPLHTAVVVSGRNFPDALSAGSFAAYAGYPIILAAGDAVPSSVTRSLGALRIDSTLVVGGPPAVSDRYMAGLPSATRLGGADRYATSALVARYTLDHGLLADRLVVASGANFPDALAGAVLGGRARAALLLTQPSLVPTSTAEVMSDLAGRTVHTWVLGGTPALGAETFDAVRAIVTSAAPTP